MASNRQTRLANRYSKALVHAYISKSADGSVTTEVVSHLKNAAHVLIELSQAVVSDRDTLLFFKNPTVSLSTKESVVKKVLDVIGANDAFLNSFLNAVLRNGRFEFIQQIAEAFSAEVRIALNVLMVKVTTAREISVEEKDVLSKKISSSAGREIEFSWLVDPRILGGLVLEFEGKRYDSSLHGKLHALKESIGI